MKVVISAGGTGGHIYPALAIINKIKEEEPNSEFLYIGTTNRMESEIIPKENIPYLGIEIYGLNRKKPWKNITVINKLLKSMKKVEEALLKFNPDVVIGVGGYVTFPVIYKAKKMGYKTFIHEQNSIPGLSNKLLSKYADIIGVSLPKSLEYFDKSKTHLTGNPRSEEVLKVKTVLKSEYKLSKNKKLITVVMGSLGSSSINDKLKDTISAFSNKSYEVIIVTGKSYYDEYKKLTLPNNVKIVPYLDNMLGVLKITDLLVSRAGASTISEITTLKVPTILIPSPYVTHNHQMENAKELLSQNAAILLEEKDFNSKNLVNQIDLIINNDIELKRISNNLSKIAITDSATRIYKLLKQLVNGE